jgi:hypothetical protein
MFLEVGTEHVEVVSTRSARRRAGMSGTNGKNTCEGRKVSVQDLPHSTEFGSAVALSL